MLNSVEHLIIFVLKSYEFYHILRIRNILAELYRNF